jgi:hypothetical protein
MAAPPMGADAPLPVPPARSGAPAPWFEQTPSRSFPTGQLVLPNRADRQM